MLIKTKKFIVFFILFFIIGGFVVGALPQPAKAQVVTVDSPSIFRLVWDKLGKVWDKIDKQILATAFKKSLGTFLNKLAYDSAVYVAAGGTGQKGLVNPFKGNYMLDLAEGVTGEFIDELAQKSGLVGDPAKLAECVAKCPKDANGKTDATCSAGCKQSTGGAFGTYSLCEPVDLTAKANLLLSFKKPKEPPAPKCSLTKMAIAAQKSANDNLLEFNAGFEESEGGLNITLRGLNEDQIFQTTQAQKTLTDISEDLTKFLAELYDITSGIAEAAQLTPAGGVGPSQLGSITPQTFAESQLERIKDLEAEFYMIKNQLELMDTNAAECINDFSKNGSVCGNNVVSTEEACDSKDRKLCTSACKLASDISIDDCANMSPAKQCDFASSNLNGMTCLGLGYSSVGQLDCDSYCHFSVKKGAVKQGCSPIQTGICTDTSLMPHCADFTNTSLGDPNVSATSCLNNSSLALQYFYTILSVVADKLITIEGLIETIENKTFDNPNANPKDIANAFNPEANEMGQFGKIQETLSQKTQDQLEHEKLKTLAEGPCKGVTKPITGEVVTPSAATCAAINEALAKSTKGQETFTGTFADAFGVFVNTLTSKLMERYFKKGLSLVFDKDGLQGGAGESGCTSWEDTKDENKADKSVRDLFTSNRKKKCKDKTEDILRSGASLGGKAAAEKALGNLLTASVESGGQQDILSILAACPPEQPALNNCIIDEPLRRAIEKQFTVKEAMEAYKKTGGSEGLDPKKPFGYILVGASMDEPDFKNGYSYRSMLYLRKYRIIPVGWELAAQYIKDIEATKQVHTLENVMGGFDDPNSPFFGLADPAWVLKAPAVFCARQGPGPELLSTEIQCERFNTGGTAQCMSDDYQSRKVSRKEWCADEQTCLEEGENGDCKRYGYCTLEKPSWKLGGTQCDKPFASCEGYTNSITKASYTVLENTLNKADCNAGNVGCQWYCQDAPKMCKGGTRGGQPCGINNDCASIYCSVGTCSSGTACSYDNDCGSGATGFCSTNSATSCTTATVNTDCLAGSQCILCNTGAHACVNGDTPGIACTTNAQCGRGVVDGVCEEGGAWSCQNTGTCSNSPFAPCTKATEIAVCGTGNVCNLTGDRINLDRDVKKCEAKDAGCNQFIKVAPGTNLIGNSGFEDDADLSPSPLTIADGANGYANKWYLENNNALGSNLKASIDNTRVHSGKNSLYIEMDSAPNDFTQGLWMGDNTTSYSVVPTGFAFNSEKSYTASAWVYIQDAADTDSNSVPDARITVGFGDFAGTLTNSETNQLSPQWERISATIPAGSSPKEIRIYPTVGSGSIRFYIDDLQLEESDTANSYVQYGSSNQAYLNGRRLQCEKQEVGCNLYTPSDGGDPIPAVIKTKDQCPAECAGYAPFYQMPSFFEPTDDTSDYPNIIPASGVSCPASSMGCEEFTNLDTVASGGEAKEYYTRLRQCAKPGTTTEATFYTWEGSEEAGFQLRAWRLKADGARPYTTDGSAGCADITNPDCRTFYDQNGITFSEELSSTVFISTDCHPLRKTIQGTREDCANSGGRTDPPVIVNALNSLDIVTCFYDAIPSQGLKCAAKEAGCREYRGSAGNNLRVLLNDDFEDLTSQGWTPSSLSSESLTIGGRSYVLKNSSTSIPVKQTVETIKSVVDLVTQNETYMLEFWAKPKYNPPGVITTINAKFFGSAGATPLFQPTKGIEISGDWNKYALGPFTFNVRPPAADESLKIFTKEEGGADAIANDCDGNATNADCTAEFYLDNIVLREITDNPYLIKDSWKTPVSCLIEPEITKTFSTLPTTLTDDITNVAVGNLTVGNSNGFDSPSGALIIDGEVIEYDSLAGNVFNISTRGARKTSSAAHLATASVWPVDEGAMLGCKEYTNRFNQKTYLRSFDNLCGEDKVGCTEMINTYNSRSSYEQTTKGEYIPHDAVEYIVDDPKLYCNASSKGCEKLGQPALGQSGEVSSWGETYLINDPDQYAQIACESSENMCSEFITRTGGTTYFKDPKDALCEYHSSINIEGIITKGWFKKGVIPAALGGLIFYDSDGDSANDTYAHLECATTSGAWDETKWTYSCPNDQVGCTEYQTPAVSTRQTGSQYAQTSNGGSNGTMLQSDGNGTFQYRFDVLESGSYNLSLSTQNWDSGTKGDDIFNIDGVRHNLTISVDGTPIKNPPNGILDGSSSPKAPPALLNAQSTTISLGNLERGKRIISIQWTNDWNDGGGAAVGDSNLQVNSLILSKSAGSNYYNLEQGVDTSSCTGVVDPEKGCVAFYDATNPILNIKSSAISGNAFAPAACQKCSLDAASCSTSSTCKPESENCCCTNNSAVTNPCDSNTILKVMADRQCAEWLACTESEKTTDSKGNMIEMCKKRQACYKTGDGVECAADGLVAEAKQNQTFDNPVAVDVPATHAGVVADANLRSGLFKAGLHWAKFCRNDKALSCQVDSDCGANGPCDSRPKMVCSLNTGQVCATNSDCGAGEGICGAFVEGYYPYGQMTQGWCSNPPNSSCTADSDCGPGNQCLPKTIVFEDDFETYQSGELLPQCAADPIACPADTVAPGDGCEENNKGICLNYWPTGSAKATNKEFKFGGQSLLILNSNKDAASAIISKPISVKAGTYALTVWINTKDLQPQDPSQKSPNYLQIDVAGVGSISVKQSELQDWTKYIAPFAVTAAGDVNIKIYMAAGGNVIKSGSKAYVDMISLAPVLAIQYPPDARSLPKNYSTIYDLVSSTSAAYTDRSCRIFAKPDALSCKYRERNTGREIQGWRGFCAEADPKNPEYCLQWWPIDLIKGEDISKF